MSIVEVRNIETMKNPLPPKKKKNCNENEEEERVITLYGKLCLIVCLSLADETLCFVFS